MPDQHTEADAKLKKLGERVREGFAKTHPVPDKNLDTVRDAVREQWELEQKAKREKTTKEGPAKTRDKEREPEEPGESR